MYESFIEIRTHNKESRTKLPKNTLYPPKYEIQMSPNQSTIMYWTLSSCTNTMVNLGSDTDLHGPISQFIMAPTITH